MVGPPAPDLEIDDLIDACIDAYEADRAGGDDADLSSYLPPPTHPHYLAVLRELVRVDLEYGWGCRRPRPLHEYRRRFPALFKDPQALQEVTIEEYRLRLLAGADPTPEEYQRQYGVSTSGWPTPDEARQVCS